MLKNKLGENSPIPKFIHLKIWRRDGVESLTTLEEGEFKVHIGGCISWLHTWHSRNLLFNLINLSIDKIYMPLYYDNAVNLHALMYKML